MTHQHTVEELLALRDGSEYLYRTRVLELLGAVRTTTEPINEGRLRRRIEGTATIPAPDGPATAIIVFAVGNNGKGTAADAASKDGLPSTRSLLSDTPHAQFAVLITTGPPPPRLAELAATSKPPIRAVALPDIVAAAPTPQPPPPRSILHRIPLPARLRARPAPPEPSPHPLLTA